MLFCPLATVDVIARSATNNRDDMTYCTRNLKKLCLSQRQYLCAKLHAIEL